MMKIFKNKNTFLLMLFLIVSFFLLPKSTLAYTQESVCKNMEKIQEEISKEQNKTKEEISVAREKRREDILNAWLKDDKLLSTERKNYDLAYSHFLNQIKNSAKTPENIIISQNLEKEFWNIVKEARSKSDSVWQEYKNKVLLSISKQDSMSNIYIKEMEIEGQNRLNTLLDICQKQNLSEIKSGMSNLKKMRDLGIARHSFLRKSKIEINNLSKQRNEQLEFIKEEFLQKLESLYSSLPAELK